ncbi:hypothetical protein Tco_0991845 [Tanacetum coccineum]|uniref:Uncharacterized protein n=1 Tax=Tanacetum coccineum TaxID=301880 RepID=A0ABQ5F0D8_9ASTR
MKHVQDMEIELPGDLKEIPIKLETFTSTISSLSSQEKLKTLDSFTCLLTKVTDTLNRFSTIVENASGATRNNVPSAGQASASPAEGEKNTTKDVETNLQNELVDLLGIDIVEQYHNKKLLFDKYCNKMVKRRKSSKIINCDVLTQKGPILLKVYREDRKIEVIANFKVSDLHLAEWREVLRILGSIFTSVYAAVQKLKKVFGKSFSSAWNYFYNSDCKTSYPFIWIIYDLWLMRIEQYFLMTDYSLWEVILNGNKVLRRTVGEVEQEYEPTSTEEKQDMRNEMKSRGTLLMALPNKDQMKFHS